MLIIGGDLLQRRCSPRFLKTYLFSPTLQPPTTLTTSLHSLCLPTLHPFLCLRQIFPILLPTRWPPRLHSLPSLSSWHPERSPLFVRNSVPNMDFPLQLWNFDLHILVDRRRLVMAFFVVPLSHSSFPLSDQSKMLILPPRRPD